MLHRFKEPALFLQTSGQRRDCDLINRATGTRCQIVQLVLELRSKLDFPMCEFNSNWMYYRGVRLLFAFLAFTALVFGQQSPQGWQRIFNGKDLSGWQVVGNGLWHVTRDGVLIGQRDTTKKSSKNPDQSWLYTVAEHGEYDLHIEYWLRYRSNSGISIRDATRARYAGGEEADPARTPSHNGYEIQIINGYDEKFPTGSLYLFQAAKGGTERPYEWNTMDVEVRDDMIRVRVNGQLVTEHPGDPKRPKAGPIGLQLHDVNTVIMFRDVRIRPYRRASKKS